MPTIKDFFNEVNEIFGFYYDVHLACSMAGGRIAEIQTMMGSSDESTWRVIDKPPGARGYEGVRHFSALTDIENTLHRTTYGALKERMALGGFDIQKAAQAAIVFAYHIWDEKYRPALVDRADNLIAPADSDVMGDLRHWRHSIIHNKGIASNDVAKCKRLTRFKPGDAMTVTNEHVAEVIFAIRDDLAQFDR
jgi:hypothetical protein